MPEVLMKMIDLPEGFGYAGVYREPEPLEWLLVDDKPVLMVPGKHPGRGHGHCIILNGPGTSEKIQWLREERTKYLARVARKGELPGRWLADLVAAIETLERAGAN